MVSAYQTIWEVMQTKKTPNLRVASFITALEKVAAAYLARGIFP